jgi:flagellar biosynthetic protein FliR
MTELTALVGAASFGFTLVLARVAGALVLLPGLGETAAPAMARAGFALTLTLLLLPGLLPILPDEPDNAWRAGMMIGAEAITGLWFGLLARLVALALPMAAQIIAYLMGLATVLQPDPVLGPQTTAPSRLFDLAIPVLILATPLYQLPLSALAELYTLIPPGDGLNAADGARAVLAMVSESFALALRLAAPFILAATAWNVASGLLARLVPRLQIFFIAMPAQILGGLLLLFWLIGSILTAWTDTAARLLAAPPIG